MNFKFQFILFYFLANFVDFIRSPNPPELNGAEIILKRRKGLEEAKGEAKAKIGKSEKNPIEMSKFGKEFNYGPILLEFLKKSVNGEKYKLEKKSKILIDENGEYRVTYPERKEELLLKELLEKVPKNEIKNFEKENKGVMEFFKRGFEETRKEMNERKLMNFLQKYLTGNWVPKSVKKIVRNRDGTFSVNYDWGPTKLQGVYEMIEKERREKIERDKADLRVMDLFGIKRTIKDKGEKVHLTKVPSADDVYKGGKMVASIGKAIQRRHSTSNLVNLGNESSSSGAKLPFGGGHHSSPLFGLEAELEHKLKLWNRNTM